MSKYNVIAVHADQPVHDSHERREINFQWKSADIRALGQVRIARQRNYFADQRGKGQ
jgi:hypothetical protein